MATVVRDEQLEQFLRQVGDDQLVKVSHNEVAKTILNKAKQMGQDKLAKWLKSPEQAVPDEVGTATA